MGYTDAKHIKELATLFDDIHALIAILKGKDHVLQYGNKLYFKSINQPESNIGLPIIEIIPELKEQGIIEILDTVFQTGTPYKIDQFRIELNIDGTGVLTEMYFSLAYNPIRNNEGVITGIFVHAVDITELVKAKLNAEQSREDLNNLILNAPVATAMYSGKEMIVELANDKMIALWGKDKNVTGKRLQEVLPELEDQPFLRLLDEVYETGITYHANEQKAILEVNNKLQPFWFNFSYKPMYDKNGKVYGILNMALDVTYQVEAKQKLAQAEEKLRSAIEVANLGTWEFDIKTGAIKLNKTLLDWRGIDQSQVITVENILENAFDEDEVLHQIHKALQPEANGIINVEYDIINLKTKEHRRLHSQGKTFYNEQNEPVLMAGITQDVTLQRLTEKELADKVAQKTADVANANNDLRQLNANLEQFVYVASHDLQEPLRKINIFSDMLLNSKAEISDEGKIYIEKIEKAAKRMSLLINDLLEFSRVSSKERIFVPTDLNKIINDIKVDYELLIKQKNATLDFANLPQIDAIPLQMNQLFYNLIGNALKFTKDDTASVIKITCNILNKEEVAALKLNSLYTYCSIKVIDNGIGFDQKYAAQIFEIFQRLHGKQEYAGTGIGLALAKKIADNHGGAISASSQPNNGATFNVILPINRKIFVEA